MGFHIEGKVYIPIEEFWAWVFETLAEEAPYEARLRRRTHLIPVTTGNRPTAMQSSSLLSLLILV